MKYTFKVEDDNTTTSYEFESDDYGTWKELTDKFQNFLAIIGFVYLSEDQFGSKFSEILGKNNND